MEKIIENIDIGTLNDKVLLIQEKMEKIKLLNKKLNSISKDIELIGKSAGIPGEKTGMGQLLKKKENIFKDQKEKLINEVVELRKVLTKSAFGESYNETEDKEEFNEIKKQPLKRVEQRKEIIKPKKEEPKVIIETKNIEKQVTSVEPKKNTQINTEIKNVKKEKKSNVKIDNLRIDYNAKKCAYTLNYDVIKNGTKKREKATWNLAKKLLNDKKIRKNIENEYGKKRSKSIDVNIALALKTKIDARYNTNLSKEYCKNNLNAKIIYNFRRSSKWLNIKDKFKQYNIARRQIRFNNVKIYNSCLSISSLAVFATLALYTIAPQAKKGIDYVAQATTQSIENDITEETNFDFDKKENLVTFKQDNFSKEDENKVTNSVPNINEISTEVGSINNNEENISSSNEEAKEECLGLGLGDRVSLKNRKISQDAWGNSGYLNPIKCDYYKISKIAVYENNDVLDVITVNNNSDLRTNEIYEKYGDNVSIALNFDGYIEGNDKPLYKNIGWGNINLFVQKKQTEDISQADIQKVLKYSGKSVG